MDMPSMSFIDESLVSENGKLEKALRAASIDTEAAYARLLRDLSKIVINDRLEAVLAEHVSAFLPAFYVDALQTHFGCEPASRDQED
jgi:hypothetical protein